MDFCTVEDTPKLVIQTGTAFRDQLPKVFDHVQFKNCVSSKATSYLFISSNSPPPNRAILSILALTICSAAIALSNFPADTSWKFMT